MFAEEVVARPLLDSRFVGDRFAMLASEIRCADARPAEGVRATSAALVMITAINEFRHAPRERSSAWLMLIGAALPLLRQETFEAMNDERERRER
ncbi:hypothetical protein [Mesorhizobium sp.]|uniref:hypothetical protein n=1 Tax=Mesorhizobium sp. TaxID=1871066 RepID=UPI0025E22451|nr:hypothetical protein [Mesorhizobium sp.]